MNIICIGKGQFGAILCKMFECSLIYMHAKVYRRIPYANYMLVRFASISSASHLAHALWIAGFLFLSNLHYFTAQKQSNPFVDLALCVLFLCFVKNIIIDLNVTWMLYPMCITGAHALSWYLPSIIPAAYIKHNNIFSVPVQWSSVGQRTDNTAGSGQVKVPRTLYVMCFFLKHTNTFVLLQYIVGHFSFLTFDTSVFWLVSGSK